MQKLASGTIGAIQLFVVSLALFSFVVAWLVSSLFQFMSAMGKRAGIRKFTNAVELPKFANFCLEFHFKALLARTLSSFLGKSHFWLSIFLWLALASLSH